MGDKEAKLKLEHTAIIDQLQQIEQESIGIAGDIDSLRSHIKTVEGLNDEVVRKGVALSEILIQLELETKKAVCKYQKLLASKTEVENSKMGARADEVKKGIQLSQSELFNLRELNAIQNINNPKNYDKAIRHKTRHI